MATISVKSMTGAEAGSLNLSDHVFAADQNVIVVREVYNAFRANQRQGNHATKTRGLVSGGGKKPWKQKGTGRARQGSTRAPQWRHGAIIFGPQPRDYREKVNRRKRRIAFRAVLTSRLAEGSLHVVESADFSAEPKTRRVVAFLDALGATGRVLIVTKDKNEMLMRASRNLPHVDVAVSNALSIYDLLVADTLVVTREAAEAIQEMLS